MGVVSAISFTPVVCRAVARRLLRPIACHARGSLLELCPTLAMKLAGFVTMDATAVAISADVAAPTSEAVSVILVLGLLFTLWTLLSALICASAIAAAFLSVPSALCSTDKNY
jgi:hypothetical protein